MLDDKSGSTFVVHKPGILHWLGNKDGDVGGALELLCLVPLGSISLLSILFIYLSNY